MKDSMPPTRFEDWERWHRDGCTRLPSVVVCEHAALPASWEKFADAPVSVLLESGRTGRYTYLCDRPERVMVGSEAGAEIRSADGETRLGWLAGKPLEVLTGLLAERKTPAVRGGPPMVGGFIGARGYDIVHTWENCRDARCGTCRCRCISWWKRASCLCSITRNGRWP